MIHAILNWTNTLPTTFTVCSAAVNHDVQHQLSQGVRGLSALYETLFNLSATLSSRT